MSNWRITFRDTAGRLISSDNAMSPVSYRLGVIAALQNLGYQITEGDEIGCWEVWKDGNKVMEWWEEGDQGGKE